MIMYEWSVYWHVYEVGVEMGDQAKVPQGNRYRTGHPMELLSEKLGFY
jgi:hypothetical protein